MKLPILLCFLACAAFSQPAHAQAIDPVPVSPDRYRVLVDNNDVRVVEYVLRPGERDEWHTRPAKVSYVVSGGTLRITRADGTSSVADERQATAQLMNTSGRHYATNVGKTPVRVVVTEVKNGAPVTATYIAPTAPAAPSAPAYIAPAGGSDCISRMANTPGRGTSMIETAKLLPGNPMSGFLPSAPRRIVISVVVDSAGRADPATLQVPAELDTAGINGLRTVLPSWRFVPARVSGCAVKQVVRITFTH
jgi:quercetin dioxygenase-like cupin family protein